MTTVIVPVGPAVDAIQRVPVACWVGPFDSPAGFPNYPVWYDAGGPVDSLAAATLIVWDGPFGGVTARLLEAIAADPARVPADATSLTREALIGLYPEAVLEPEVTL